ncbi:MAG: hypothetical protein KME26_24500 [Oscillatoria princeps RMCB-10]|jgi:hypothetical protein|nr:hypothetical protein [Oscillatoria princeps RMCB-10]
MLRKLITLLMVVTLSYTTVACGGPSAVQSPNPSASTQGAQTRLSDGQYPVQQATYNDANGEYSLFLLNTSPPVFNTADLQMARLTDQEISAGQKSYVKVENGKASLHLSEDFKIEYVHAVTETRTNPQTGQPQTVIVRQESNFWAPFAGALAGQAIGSMLFTPRYYVPPVYQPGVPLTGYGGYGNTYGQAVQQYQTRYQAPPLAERNRTQLRTTGRINSPQTGITRPSGTSERDKATGSGFGTSTLKPSGQSSPAGAKPRTGSFGSGRSSRPAGFGSGRRR